MPYIEIITASVICARRGFYEARRIIKPRLVEVKPLANDADVTRSMLLVRGML